jgi:hypothetical protein
MPNCWLQVSLHLEGPATGQLDQGFPWFSSILEQVGTQIPRCTALLHVQPPPPPANASIKCFSNSALPTLISKSRPYAVKPLFHLFPLLVTKSTSQSVTLLHFPTIYRTSAVPLPAGRAGTERKPTNKAGTFFYPPLKYSFSLHFLFLLNLRELSNYSFNVKWALVTTAWRVLRLRVEETASRYGG